MPSPKLLALDFDGVICDSIREGLRTAWQVCRQIRGGDGSPSPETLAAFVRLRPVLEYGWEFPVLLLAFLEGVPEADLLRDFQTVWRDRVLTTHHLSPIDLAARFDAARDRAIQANRADWLADQGLYPGVADRLRAILQSGLMVFVLTTKEGRFARQLLEIHGVTMPAAQVWGKEQARPKAELLRVLHHDTGVGYDDIWFVEDRLKTLQAAERQTDLSAIGLFFATWGYSTPTDRAEAVMDPRIVPLTLEQFRGDFSAWTRSGPD